MTEQEIAARFLHPAFPQTPERLAKAKRLALASRRPTAFLDLIAALPDVPDQMVEQAHQVRLQHLQTALTAVRAQVIGKTDLVALGEQQRRIEYLEIALREEHMSHADWQAQRAGSQG